MMAIRGMFMIKRGSREWNYAWEKIKERFGSYSCRCSRSGVVWQYMATQSDEKGFYHGFNHRSLNGRITTYSVDASGTDNVLEAYSEPDGLRKMWEEGEAWLGKEK